MRNEEQAVAMLFGAFAILMLLFYTIVFYIINTL